MYKVIATFTSDSPLLKDEQIETDMAGAMSAIRNLPVRRVRDLSTKHRHIVAIEYDSILVGATVYFSTVRNRHCDCNDD